LPDEWNRQQLAIGEWGKLMFRFPVHRDPEVERLWVRVTGYTSLGYKGVVDNDASNIEFIRTGEVIEFEPRLVISIWPPRFYFDSLTLEEGEGHAEEAKGGGLQRLARGGPESDEIWRHGEKVKSADASVSACQGTRGD
jgi:hypothetical protein